MERRSGRVQCRGKAAEVVKSGASVAELRPRLGGRREMPPRSVQVCRKCPFLERARSHVREHKPLQ